MGSFFKQIYRYSHPRPYRHNENLWPHVKIERAASGEIIALRYKKQPVPIADLAMLKGSCHGDVLLTATGPSINSMQFDALPPMPAIGVNGAYFLHNEVDFRFYVIVDMGFIDRRPDIVEGIIRDENILLFTTVQGVAKIIDKATLANVKCRFAVIEDAAYKTYQPRIPTQALRPHYCHAASVSFCPENHAIAFNHDIRSGIFDAGTVVYWAFQIISYLGFEQLLIAGLDMNNFHLPRFYETAANKLPTFLADKVDDLIIPAFAHASHQMKLNNIAVKNLSPTSAISSDIFEKVDSNELFIQPAMAAGE
ncbi:Kdo-III transferase WaaZ [Gibbsiella quercinecans]|uniref:Sugar glycosyltransferase n=1 Tax=Gibbsiella quercinecans TaxID=929813 RepID=A0A250AWN7_9GAMM|nr:sugar glycosyltransferase [Gibbsiella quercinecans]ATA18112.1 sugar glycosyltransferase [Gibbsiella quercinecans]RLM05972.1 sugar glycosyltransferase [Gibbsiella quercinecans]RLM10344.1 sugar glycosyltransferase [Gibbsiella quercinecans]RLM12876.1 sugar glycosyltransferase [Gibbsiella quercinecans]TCT92441.1 Kdo-III transferase WaaZ [Gibbsiella quercinecans]